MSGIIIFTFENPKSLEVRALFQDIKCDMRDQFTN